MKPENFTGKPCECPECYQAGVTDRPTVRDPVTGRWLHGYPLKRYWNEADAALARIRERLNRAPGGPHASDQ